MFEPDPSDRSLPAVPSEVLSSLSILEARRQYPLLPEPSRLPCGDYRAVLIGPAPFRVCAAAGLTLGGLPRWLGKRFRADGSGVNLLRAVAANGPVEERLPMRLALGRSRFGDGAVVRVGYDPAAPWPWPAVVDELKPWPDGGADAWLGMARTDWRLTRGVAWLRLPFLLLPLGAAADQRATAAGTGVG